MTDDVFDATSKEGEIQILKDNIDRAEKNIIIFRDEVEKQMKLKAELEIRLKVLENDHK